MPIEVVIAGASVLLSLLLLAMALMRHWPQVIVAAPMPKHPCGYVLTV